jgi:ATP-dependent RNA helicase HelY
MERLKPALRAWLTGQPFTEIEVALGVPAHNVRTCKRPRDFALRLMNRRFYLITAALPALVQQHLAQHGVEKVGLAALEIFAIALRKGLDTP